MEFNPIGCALLRNMPQGSPLGVGIKKAEAIASALLALSGRGHLTNSVSSSSIFSATFFLSMAINSRIRLLLLIEVLKPSRL